MSTLGSRPKRLLLLVKRRYMGRDLPDDRYGRFFELAIRLAAEGRFEITAVCLDYRSVGLRKAIDQDGVRWLRLSFPLTRPWHIPRAIASLDEVAADIDPDLVLSASDAFCTVLGDRLANRLAVPHVADLYDNFESYPATRLPGLRGRYHAALARADQIHCISRPLADYITERCRPRGEVGVLENGVESARFFPQAAADKRDGLGLPRDVPIIGTVGALHPNRDTRLLFEAHARLRESRPDLLLVIAGPLHRSLKHFLRADGVRYLGVVDYASVPDLLAAIDVHVICNRDSAFGRYCYPQKFWEVVACGRPLVAADVGAVSSLLEGFPGMRYRVGDLNDLVTKLDCQLDRREVIADHPVTWEQVATRLGERLAGLIDRRID